MLVWLHFYSTKFRIQTLFPQSRSFTEKTDQLELLIIKFSSSQRCFFTLVLTFNQKTFLKRDRGNHWHLFPVAIGLCLVFRNKCEKSCVAVGPKTRCEKCFSSIDLFTQIFCDIDVKKHTLVFSYVHVHHSLNTSKVAEHHMLMWSRSLNNSCLSKVIVSRLDGLSSS